MNYKKILKISGITLFVLLVCSVSVVIYVKRQVSLGNLIYWDGKWYTKEELGKVLPVENFDWSKVPDKNTPEEAYTVFRNAVLNDDIETALTQVRNQKKDEYRKILSDKENSKTLKEALNNSGELKKSSTYSYDSMIGYDYKTKKNGQEVTLFATFEKNIDGYWQIDSL